MHTIHPLQQAILHAHAQGRKAIIPFITAGYPSPDTFWDCLSQLDQGGADIIEIGVPFSDPVADGPVIEDASRHALEQGISLHWILQGLLHRKGQFSSQLVLMGYANPFLQYGIDQLAKDATEAGITGFIIPDMPLEESSLFRPSFDQYDIALIPLVAPNTTEARMRQYANTAKGFVYVVSVLGITGGNTKLTDTVTATMQRARNAFNIPLALGFGLQTPDQLNALPKEAQPDAAVLGSALLRHLAKGKSAKEFLVPWVQ
ncbi:MAG: tryptophan synthase subunit alpha [Akkermansia sp.]